MQWVFGLYLASIAYGITRSMQFISTDDDAPRWEFLAVKFFQVALIPFFAYGLFRWFRGFLKDRAGNHE